VVRPSRLAVAAAGRAGGWPGGCGLVRLDLDVWVQSVQFDRAADYAAGMTGDRWSPADRSFSSAALFEDHPGMVASPRMVSDF
jgi:hypothetical protein